MNLEEVYLNQSPNEKGWYLIINDSDKIIPINVYETTEEHLVVTTLDGVDCVINKKNWKMYQINNDKMTYMYSLLQIKPLKECIASNVVVDMAHRMELTGKDIALEVDGIITPYKVISCFHHIHSWTIFNVEGIENRTQKQIMVTGRDNIKISEKGEWKECKIKK